ncbi:hypothetical protein LguiA_011713 [Lonicera macranthoides]
MDIYSWFRRRKDSSATGSQDKEIKQDDEEFFGITDQLIHLINSFTLDTFKNFPLPDEQETICGDDAKSGNVQPDLSDWQERHATLVLSKVKELSQLRFRLCPRYLKERQFWRIYFTLVKNIVAEYELHAIRVERLKQMTVEKENVKKTSGCEVEMLETKQTTTVAPATLVEENANALLSNN